MLRELKIKNLAIIEDLTIRFEYGLNVLTGETGAGKSIIVDALGLALGDRAQSDLIKSGEKEASVQAFFEIDDNQEMEQDIGVDASEGVVLRRILSAGGKSRAYINDAMVTLQTLHEAGKSLVDIHSQHEHQSLVAAEKQRNILDSYGAHQEEVRRVRELYTAVQALEDEYQSLTEKVKERAYMTDLLKFQINEIDSASLKPGEKESLEEEFRILSNISRLKEMTETAYSLLYGAEGSCIENLSRVMALMKDMKAIDGSLEDTLTLAESARPLLEDAAIALRVFRDKYSSDPDRLDIIQDRLDLIRRLEKKFGPGIEGVLEHRGHAADELERLEASDERLQAVAAEVKRQTEKLFEAAGDLSEKRKKTARAIERLMEKSMKELAFMHAGFKIDVGRVRGTGDKDKINGNGLDRIEFLFSANPGEPLKPLTKIASGGELSRVMLALKSILAALDNVPVLIFDEVDAGIGGKTAETVGKKLLQISEKHQLLCITHLPQIASLGDVHLKIEKKLKNSKVAVEVTELAGRERRDEIARMLSGTVTEISRRHAGELLERVR